MCGYGEGEACAVITERQQHIAIHLRQIVGVGAHPDTEHGGKLCAADAVFNLGEILNGQCLSITLCKITIGLTFQNWG